MANFETKSSKMTDEQRLRANRVRNKRRQEDRAWKAIQPWFNRQTAAARAFLGTKTRAEKRHGRIRLGLRPGTPWYPRWNIATWSPNIIKATKDNFRRVQEFFQYQGRLGGNL